MKLRGIFNVHRRDIELTKYMALAAVSGNDGSKIISEEIRLKSNRVLCVCSNCGIDGENLKYCGRVSADPQVLMQVVAIINSLHRFPVWNDSVLLSRGMYSPCHALPLLL